MQASLIRPTSPEWYSSALAKLHSIQSTIGAYADEDFLVPSSSVFDAVSVFLEDLCARSQKLKLEQPDIAPTPNGHLELTYRGDNTALVIQFKPALQFYAKNSSSERSGTDSLEAFIFIQDHFRF